MTHTTTDRKSSESRFATVIVNPTRLDGRRLRAAVAAEEERQGWLPSAWLETTIDDPGQSVATAALLQHPDLIIVAGGDGTIRAVSEQVPDSSIPIAIVPTGTGNLLARNLGLKSDIESAVRTAFTGSDRLIDAGFVNMRHEDSRVTRHMFLVMTGIGLDASMAADSTNALKKRIGWLAYTDSISRSVIRNKQFLLRYRLDGSPEENVHAHTVIVGNCGTLTAGILLLPDARPDDGRLDVVVFRPKGFWQWARIGSRLAVARLLHRTRFGTLVLRVTPHFRALQYRQARTLEARFDEPQRIELDGDDHGFVTGVTVTVHPSALTFRSPSTS
ncbi:diacylglycerol/lipid kinase family protein [Paramicrobacterium chengjingii]|uniref:diacylglycerol/lipid kinase family protein n=1 Tax=Paramicrobacterium chengjingii TaxID=2769067 RepID=UPI001FD62E4D|nr:diacylglycerol kinase family protein [Microbacterium chengjingii]